MSNATDSARADNKVEILLHPTDFSPDSDLAHALRLALTNNAELKIFHVSDNDRDDVWEKFPSVRRILSKWGMIDENSDRSAVTALGIQVEKVLIRGTQRKLDYHGYRRYQWMVGCHSR